MDIRKEQDLEQKTVMQAIDATMQEISLSEYALTHVELKESLDKWGFMKPR